MRKKLVILSAALLLTTNPAWAQSYGQNKIQYVHKDWNYIQTKHFDIYYYQNGEHIADFTAAVAESALVTISRSFQFELIARIPFLIYNSHNEFEETNVTAGLQPESVGGFTEFFKGRIVLPYEGSNEQFRHVVHHELLHAVFLQYFYGAGAGAIIRGIMRFQIPLWLNEGLAEYESMHWDTNADNMIRDAVINSYLPPLNYLEYMAYQGGQSFYYWVERKYGRAKVTELLQEIRSTQNINRALVRALGENMEQISEQWQKTLKQWYWPEIDRRDSPADFASPFTDHRKTSNYINNSPALSPDGSRLAYLTDKSGLFDIRLMNAITGQDMGKIVGGQKQSGVEELKWLRPDISWTPDNNYIMFVAKSGWQDVLHLADVNSKKIVKTFELGFEGIWNPTISPDGKRVIFSAMKHNKDDLYILELESQKLSQVTDDYFSDFEPSWSPDGQTIAFASDRGDPEKDFDRPVWHHDYGNSDIYLIRPDGSGLKRLTFDDSDEKNPEFYHSPDTLMFISDRNGIFNVYLKVLSTGDDIPLTNLLVGAQQISIARSGRRLAFTSFYRGGYDIYLWRKPLGEIDKYRHTSLEFTDAKRYQNAPIGDFDAPQLANLSAEQTTDRPYQHFVFDRDFSQGVLNNGRSNKDALATAPNSMVDDSTYAVQNYKPKFSVDYVGGSGGYDPFWGLQGIGQVYLSDMTGDHQIGIGAYLNRSIANSDFNLSYTYQGYRSDLYFALVRQVDFFLTNVLGIDTVERFRYFGVISGARYPFSRFSRLDLSVLYVNRRQDNLDIPPEFVEPIRSSAIILGAELSKDNTRWGYYGPVDNTRRSFNIAISPGFGSDPREFYSGQIDFRRYMAMTRDGQWAMAFRLAGGASLGPQPQQFIMGGLPNWLNNRFARSLNRQQISDLTFSEFVYPVRGTDYYEQIGSRYFLLNAEIRFPFIQFLALQAPIPLLFQQVRGAVFADVGSAWSDDDSFKFFSKNQNGQSALSDVMASVGWGIRFYSPIGLFRIDAAWRTDLRYYSSPRYLFSLGTDF